VKDLARLNNLSPPYTIEVGQQLKVSGGSSSVKILFERQNRQSDAVLSGAAIVMAAGWTALLDLACQR
jgi:LysM repeat protein